MGFDAAEATRALAGHGPRHTGSVAHRSLEEMLVREFSNAGLDVLTDPYLIPRWEPASMSLSAQAGGTSTPLRVSSTYPYCGSTPGDGILAALAYLGPLAGAALAPDEVDGRIVVVDYPPTAAPLEYRSVWGIVSADGKPPPPTWGIGSQHWLALESLRARLAARGAVGLVVSWHELSPGAAAHQYQPILPPSVQKMYAPVSALTADGLAGQSIDLPTVWVTRDTRDELLVAARADGKARMELTLCPAQTSPSETIIAELPGTSSDTIIFVTHTDGVNVLQENGPMALLALAYRLSAIPRGERRCCVVLMAATAHLCRTVLRQDRTPTVAESEGVLELHPDLGRRAVAAIGVESLGSMEARDDGSGWVPTGRREWAHCLTGNPRLAQLALTSFEQAGAGSAIVAPGRVWGIVHPFQDAGVPAMSYGSSPGYVMSEAPDGHLGFFSEDRMLSELDAFTLLARAIDADPHGLVATSRPAEGAADDEFKSH